MSVGMHAAFNVARLFGRKRRCKPARHAGPFSEIFVSGSRTVLSYCVACGTVIVPDQERRSLEREVTRLMR